MVGVGWYKYIFEFHTREKRMAKKAQERPKYVTCETYDHNEERCFEPVIGTSQTVAGEAYTIKELFQRHMNMNFDNGIEKNAFYGDIEDFAMPDLSKLNQMDIFDRQAVYEEIGDRARIALKKIEDHGKEQEQIAAEKAAAEAANEAAQKNPSTEELPKGDKPLAE